MKRHLPTPISYLITSGHLAPESSICEINELLELISAAAEAGVSLVQIREKCLLPRGLYDLASKAAAITKDSGTRLLINDRADVAFAAGADGVHLTGGSVNPEVIRRSFGPDFLIGVSTHSTGEVLAAREGGADFATYGPVFESPGKGEPAGLEKLRRISLHAADFPVLALGGIGEENIVGVLEAGAAGFAAIRFLNDPEKLSGIIRRIGTLAKKRSQK